MRRYHIRTYRPIWWLRTICMISVAVTFIGMMNSWELGLI